MSKHKQQPLTWDDVADIYQRETGRKARIQPMSEVAKWAESRKDLFRVGDDDAFYLVNPK